MSNYVDVYLCFLSERQFLKELPFFGEENQSVNLSGVSVDMIGQIVTQEAVFGEEGEEITPAVIDTRFHVNIRASQSFLDEFIPERFYVTPETPRRVWA